MWTFRRKIRAVITRVVEVVGGLAEVEYADEQGRTDFAICAAEGWGDRRTHGGWPPQIGDEITIEETGPVVFLTKRGD